MFDQVRGIYPNGEFIEDVVSYGPNGELYLTITCINILPGMTDGMSASEKAARIGKEIESALKRIRELVDDGTIKA